MQMDPLSESEPFVSEEMLVLMDQWDATQQESSNLNYGWLML